MNITQDAVDWFKTQFTRFRDNVMGSPKTAVLEPEVVSETTTPNHNENEDEVNVVESMLAEVPNLSEAAKNRIRDKFPDGKVCCPIKVARAIQLELLEENPKGKIKFTANSNSES